MWVEQLSINHSNPNPASVEIFDADSICNSFKEFNFEEGNQ
jgi:hypothetical protein